MYHFDLSRRGFLSGLAATAGCASLGKWHLSKRVPVNYWCTWDIQNVYAADKGCRGEIMFPGDQGSVGARDALDEKLLFGPNGWARRYYPESREDMLLLLDDGWDVPYGLVPRGFQDMHPFGSLQMDESRFPSFGKTPSDRLRNVRRAAEDLGWAGLGIWVACQVFGDRQGALLDDRRTHETIKRLLAESAAAGVRYWKLDWGLRDKDADFRTLISELKEKYYPELYFEHKAEYTRPLNPARLEVDTPYNRALLSTGDVFRIYDLLCPLDLSTALERIAKYARLIDRIGSCSVLNCEDNPVPAAVLGHSFGAMRSGDAASLLVQGVNRNAERFAEVTEAAHWQRVAPAYGGTAEAKTVVSEETLEDSYSFRADEGWYGPAKGKRVTQTAPAVIARGMPVPEVKPLGKERPFVVAGRHPNGAVSVAALPRVIEGKFVSPSVDVILPVEVTGGTPFKSFGTVRHVSDARGRMLQ